MLALTAGVLNSVGFFAVTMYTSHMTGLAAMLADQLVLGDLRLVATAAVGLGSFIAGAACCALVFNAARRRGWQSRYAVVLVLEAVLILLIGLLANELDLARRLWPLIIVLCFTMGLQNAIITKISAAQIRTTHVTGMVTDIGIELGKLVYRSRPRTDPNPVRADLDKLGLLVLLVSAFILGGVAGAIGYQVIGFVTLVPMAMVLLGFAAIPVVDDLRNR
ncbi:YoaK family protein [Propionibacteriaceae bacterium Y2011]|uniref:YoaK family protein n=1 Tax=Microlunatus sp. Y2014 TaxID=3418488 RepID=UPI003B4A3543